MSLFQQQIFGVIKDDAVAPPHQNQSSRPHVVHGMGDCALPDPPVSLLRFLCSGGLQRLRASEAIEDSKVCVNGVLTHCSSTLIYSEDIVTVNGHPVPAFRASHAVVLAYNKPCGIEIGAPRRLCTKYGSVSSFEMLLHKLASDLQVPRLFAIGRLDKETSGLLLITNDGALSSACRTPGLLSKVYVVTTRLRRVVKYGESFDHVAAMEEARARACCKRLTSAPVELSDGLVEFHEADCFSVSIRQQRVPGEFLSGKWAKQQSIDSQAIRESRPDELLVCTLEAQIKVSLKIGRFRVVRRAVAAVGLPVCALHRCCIGPIELHDPGICPRVAPVEGSLRLSVAVGSHALLSQNDVEKLWRHIFGPRGRNCMADWRVENLRRLCDAHGSRACDGRLQDWLRSHVHKFVAPSREHVDEALSSDDPD